MMRWSLWKRIAFRLIFIYFVLYCILYWVPLEVLWGQDIRYRSNGNGDTIYHYLQALGILLAALTGTLIWGVADRKQPEHNRLDLPLRVIVCLFLAVVLIPYGAIKIIPAQFPYPDFYRLTQPFGSFSPKDLLWVFIGASPPYSMFLGGVEMLAGILLFFPRTALLGALIALLTMVQVCVLTFCYDVSAKLFSLHLLAMSVFLVARDARRLMDFLVLNRPTGSVPIETVLFKSSLLRAVSLTKLLFLALVLVTSFYRASALRASWEASVPLVERSRFQLLNHQFKWIHDEYRPPTILIDPPTQAKIIASI